MSFTATLDRAKERTSPMCPCSAKDAVLCSVPECKSLPWCMACDEDSILRCKDCEQPSCESHLIGGYCRTCLTARLHARAEIAGLLEKWRDSSMDDLIERLRDITNGLMVAA